jgi:hypothetical protein
MNRPQQVRAVYQELRRTLGDRFSARELLEQAAALVDLFTVPEDNSHFEHRQILQSGDEKLVRILKTLPDESWARLRDILL